MIYSSFVTAPVNTIFPAAFCSDSNTFVSARQLELYVVRGINRMGRYTLKYVMSDSVANATDTACTRYPHLEILEVYNEEPESVDALESMYGANPVYLDDDLVNPDLDFNATMKWEQCLNEL